MHSTTVTIEALDCLTVLSDVRIAESFCKCLNIVANTQASAILLIHSTTSSKEWTRAHRDEIRRCFDRSAQRIFPPVDSRWYADPCNWSFAVKDDDEPNALVLELRIRHFPDMPTATFSSDEKVVKAPKLSRSVRAALQYVGCEWLSQRGAAHGPPGARGESAPEASSTMSVLQFCTDTRAHRTPHVEPRGILLSALIVAQTDLVAFVAVPCASQVGAKGLAIVGRVPLPTALIPAPNNRRSTPGGSVSKRSREDPNDVLDGFGALGQVYASNMGRRANIRLVEPFYLVDLLCYRVFASHPQQLRSGDGITVGPPVVEFDDCYVVSECSAMNRGVDGSHTYGDVCDLIRASCCDALKLHRQYFNAAPAQRDATSEGKMPSEQLGDSDKQCEAAKGKAIVTELARHMMDTSSVRFPKDKKLFRVNEKLLTKYHPLGTSGASVRSLQLGSQLDTDESSVVEFKYRAAEWAAGGASSSNKERLRHTLCGMANTFGGYLLLGLRDDGVVGGISSDGAEVRTTGLCPALFQGGASTVTLRVTDAAGASAGSNHKSLPTGWWKQSAPLLSEGTTDLTARAAKVVTAIVVHSGSAPFYTPSKYATPSMRGAASTLRMPVRVCCQRLLTHLPQRRSLMASGDLLSELNLTQQIGGSDAWST